MAKMQATETAQAVVDAAVQICGGLGVKRGHPVERLYREVRALRIYEGATEVQKLIIARELLKELAAQSSRWPRNRGDDGTTRMWTRSRGTISRRARNGRSSGSTCRN